MVSLTLRTVILAIVGLAAVRASDVEGSVIIKRKLTKKRVTTPASSYERGAVVELRSDEEGDPLVFERTRVVVYLEGQIPSGPRAALPVIQTMEQNHRRFVPDTLVVPAGASVSFPNLDPIFHNVFSLSKPKTFDLGNYPMSPNQWSAKADASGRFVLPAVPPGRYTIVAWHRTAGFFRKNIQVAESAPTTVRFAIPLDETGAEIVAER
jgi:plastocyanin